MSTFTIIVALIVAFLLGKTFGEREGRSSERFERELKEHEERRFEEKYFPDRAAKSKH